MMVGTRRAEEVVDSSLEVKPSTRALKRALLVALRCVDPDADKRPKMSQVVRMLEADEYPFREVRFIIMSSNKLLVLFQDYNCIFENTYFWRNNCLEYLVDIIIFRIEGVEGAGLAAWKLNQRRIFLLHLMPKRRRVLNALYLTQFKIRIDNRT